MSTKDDDSWVDEVVELAERRIRLELEIDEINVRLEQLREQYGPATPVSPLPEPGPPPKRARQKAPSPTRAGRPFGTEEAIGFLTKLLEPGPKLNAEVLDAANKAGFCKSTIYRARAKMGIKSRKTGNGHETELSLR